MDGICSCLPRHTDGCRKTERQNLRPGAGVWQLCLESHRGARLPPATNEIDQVLSSAPDPRAALISRIFLKKVLRFRFCLLKNLWASISIKFRLRICLLNQSFTLVNKLDIFWLNRLTFDLPRNLNRRKRRLKGRCSGIPSGSLPGSAHSKLSCHLQMQMMKIY